MRLVGLITLCLALIAAAGLLHAQPGDFQPASPPVEQSTTRKDSKARPGPRITPEREAAAISFVQRNHPELAELLGYLKTSQPEEYERAIRDIFRATERLALIQERDSLQYDLEVAAWTAQSRVQLLAARLKMGATDELKNQLREALKTQNEAKLALLKHERQKAVDRVERLGKEIARFESDREQVINKQLSLLTKAADEGRRANLAPTNAAKLSPKSVKQGKKNPPTK
jgi:hypothetical protein